MKCIYTLLFSLLILSCNNTSTKNQKEINRINDWSKKIINSRDSILKNDKKYKLEVDKWRTLFKDSKDSTLIAQINYIDAKILSWTKKDSLSQILLKKCIPVLAKNEAKFPLQLVDGYYMLSLPFVKEGYLNAAMTPLSKSIFYAEKYLAKDTTISKLALKTFSDYGALNRVLKNNDIAIKYLDKAIDNAKIDKTQKLYIKACIEKAVVLNQQEKYEEANKIGEATRLLSEQKNINKTFVYNHLVNIYGNQKNFAKAKEYLAKQKAIEVKDTLAYHINNAGIELGLKNPSAAKESVDYIESKFNKMNELDKQICLYNIINYYLQTKNFGKATFYYEQSEDINNKFFTTEKAMYSEDMIKKYDLNQKEDQIKILNQDKQLLDDEIRTKSLYFWLVVLIFVVVLTILIILYLKQKNKKLVAETKLLQIEDKLLRSQMEPHFVFNAMASLQSLILENKNQESAYYLAKFARILRLSLEHSRQKYVGFAEELEAIENYLELQKLRFGNLFEYTIQNNILVNEPIAVPPMMIQPFVENSIYHGFDNLTYKGQLLIIFTKKGNFVECIIKDNGKGIFNKNENKSNNSLSTIITKERLQILTNSKDISGLIEIKNNSETEKGVIVKVKLPFIDN